MSGSNDPNDYERKRNEFNAKLAEQYRTGKLTSTATTGHASHSGGPLTTFPSAMGAALPTSSTSTSHQSYQVHHSYHHTQQQPATTGHTGHQVAHHAQQQPTTATTAANPQHPSHHHQHHQEDASEIWQLRTYHNSQWVTYTPDRQEHVFVADVIERAVVFHQTHQSHILHVVDEIIDKYPTSELRDKLMRESKDAGAEEGVIDHHVVKGHVDTFLASLHKRFPDTMLLELEEWAHVQQHSHRPQTSDFYKTPPYKYTYMSLDMSLLNAYFGSTTELDKAHAKLFSIITVCHEIAHMLEHYLLGSLAHNPWTAKDSEMEYNEAGFLYENHAFKCVPEFLFEDDPKRSTIIGVPKYEGKKLVAANRFADQDVLTCANSEDKQFAWPISLVPVPRAITINNPRRCGHLLGMSPATQVTALAWLAGGTKAQADRAKEKVTGKAPEERSPKLGDKSGDGKKGDGKKGDGKRGGSAGGWVRPHGKKT